MATITPDRAGDPAAPDPAPWRVRWTCWPGTAQPLLLTVCPTLPYPEHGQPGPAHSDAWYCRESLGMTGFDPQARIPPLAAVGLVLLADSAELRVAGRPWIAVCGGPPSTWPGLLLGRCVFVVCFTGPRAVSLDRELDTALRCSTALFGEIPVRWLPGLWRTKAVSWP